MFVIESKFGLAEKKGNSNASRNCLLLLAAIDLFRFKTLSLTEVIDQAAFSIILIITIIVGSGRCGHAIHLHQLGFKAGQRLTLVVE